MKPINIIGLGYIGLPTALVMSDSGLEIVGSDCNNDLIFKLNLGALESPEPGLEELYLRNRTRILFQTEYTKTDTYIVTVPTPYLDKSKKVDASYIISAVENILDVCEPGAVIIIESTVSPGTIDRHIRPLAQRKNWVFGRDVHLAHAPERIIPGRILPELRENSRVIGADDNDIGQRVKGIYSLFCSSEIVVTDIRTAEMTKVIENTYRDVNIAFANELAKICRADGLDVYEIIRIANLHPRVNILQPGPGVGGHCISVDPWFLVGDYPDLTNLILAARKVNDSMPAHVLRRISEIMDREGIQSISRIGLYGMTYKENVDDIRESPTLQLLRVMKDHLAQGIKVFDPYVSNQTIPEQVMTFESFLMDLDMVVIMVAHDHLIENQRRLDGKIVLDTRNILKGKAYRI